MVENHRHCHATEIKSEVAIYGYIEGQRVENVSEVIRSICQAAVEWGSDRKVHLASLDVRTAYDSMTMKEAAWGLQSQQTPRRPSLEYCRAMP